MSRYRVELRPAAARHLTAIEARIAEEATDDIARRFVAVILDRCALEMYADRGTPRDDITPGIRTLVLKRNVVIAYAVEADAGWRCSVLAGEARTLGDCSNALSLQRSRRYATHLLSPRLIWSWRISLLAIKLHDSFAVHLLGRGLRGTRLTR